MKTKLLTLITFFFLIVTPSLYAKWWIFGGGEEEVGFDYINLNALSFDDVNKEAVLLKESLDKGYLHVRGKAHTGQNPVGAITVSLDGAKTWQKAKFEKDGGFDFSFEPDLSQTYDIYVKVIDTAGKSNEIEDAHVKVSFSDLDFYALIGETLSKLKTYYEQEDDINFMQYVSRDFEGDDMTLERALRKDFSALENIRLDFTLNNVAMSGNKYYASISFNRSVIAYDGTSHSNFSDRGVTEFTFAVGEKGAMLLSMKNPLIFGLTYAADVASGTTSSAQNNQRFLSLNESGKIIPLTTEELSTNDSSNDYMTSGNFNLQISCFPPCTNADGFNFSNDEKTTLITESEVYKESNLLWGNAGAQVLNLGTVSFTGITVPNVGYSNNGSIVTVGEILAVKLANNTYALLRISNIAGGIVYFDYKYNPNGSLTFP